MQAAQPGGAMTILRDELSNVDVTISSDHSPPLADALMRGKLNTLSCALRRAHARP